VDETDPLSRFFQLPCLINQPLPVFRARLARLVIDEPPSRFLSGAVSI